MAIYSFNASFISRSEGRSSVAFSAYISASRHVDERTGVAHSFVNKENVTDSWIIAPESALEWALNPSTLWNKVEAFEDHIANLRFRSDSPDPEKQRKSAEAKEAFLNSTQPAQTVMGALPLELTLEQNRALVEEFIRTRFTSRGLIVQCAIHWDKGNPHFHGLMTRRPLVNGEFSIRKDHEIVTKPELLITRKQWEVVVNKHLALAGREERVDCRSHKDRSLLFVPGIHEGAYARQLAEEGKFSELIEKNKEIQERNIEILCEHPETLIRDLSQRRTTFTAKHIEEEIIRRVGGDTELFAILKAKMDGIENPGRYAEHENFAADVKAVAKQLTDQLVNKSDITHHVGENLNRDTVFTSTAYKNQEEKLIRLTDSLYQKASKTTTEPHIVNAIQSCEQERNITFSTEQREAVRYLCTGHDIRLLNGRAGTGKTTLLRAVALAYRDAGYNVIGTSFQGKVTETMEKDIGIPCRTLDSFMTYWDMHARQKAFVESGKLWGRPYLRAFQKMKDLEKYFFTSRDVIIVDEANMIGGCLWERFLEEVTDKGAKLLIVQDMAQIKSREPGDYGRLFAERFGTCDIRSVIRQKVAWQKESSELLNDGRIAHGLKLYCDKGHLLWCDHATATQDALVKAYLQDREENPESSRIALAYRNKDTDALNQQIRSSLKIQGVLGPSFMAAGQEFSSGDRIRFTQNDHQGRLLQNAHASVWQTIKERFRPTQSQGVKNGTFGIILSGSERQIKIQLNDGRCVKLNPAD